MSPRDQVVESFIDRTAFDDAVFLRKRMFLTHTFPGCVFVRAMQTLGRDNPPHMAMT
jgi:hypothetical protein